MGNNKKYKAGWRKIGLLKKYYRSAWEANYARYLEFQKQNGYIEKWEYEPKTFWFDGIKRGCVSYLPDFRVTLKSGEIEYHEVKGWMDKKSKTKISRMKKYYPEETLVVIERDRYNAIKKTIGMVLPGWE